MGANSALNRYHANGPRGISSGTILAKAPRHIDGKNDGCSHLWDSRACRVDFHIHIFQETSFRTRRSPLCSAQIIPGNDVIAGHLRSWSSSISFVIVFNTHAAVTSTRRESSSVNTLLPSG